MEEAGKAYGKVKVLGMGESKIEFSALGVGSGVARCDQDRPARRIPLFMA